MARYLALRIVGLLAVAWVALTATFFALHMTPGNPAESGLAQGVVSDHDLSGREAALGLDRPIILQYADSVVRTLAGDWGTSWFGGQSVSVLISQSAPATISLALTSMLMALCVGGGLGLAASMRPRSVLSGASRLAMGVLSASPIMLTGIVAIWLFSVMLGWLPATGQGSLRHLFLPAAVLGISAGGAFGRGLYGSLTEAIQQLYFRTALAKGYTRWQAVFRHALRPALASSIEIAALQLGYLLSGTVVIETTFARQGMGRLMATAVLNKDVPVVQAVVVLSITAYGLIILMVDVARFWLDPRIRQSGA